MRIDSGTSGYLYQSRSQNLEILNEETAVAETSNAAPRGAFSSIVSSTTLSPSLANALWAIDGGRKASTSSAPTGFSRGSDMTDARSIDQISARYTEFEEADDVTYA